MKFIVSALFTVCVASAFAQVNVAASANGGVASHHSTWAAQSPAEKANDGNRDGRWSAQSVQHTSIVFQAWWEVEFANVSDIDVINIWNRTDGLQNRLNPFSVFLYDSSDNVVWQSLGNTHVDNIDDGDVNTEGMAFSVGGVEASKLRVQLDGTNYLHMAEVEAITPVPEPFTLGLLGAGALALLKRRRKN